MAGYFIGHGSGALHNDALLYGELFISSLPWGNLSVKHCFSEVPSNFIHIKMLKKCFNINICIYKYSLILKIEKQPNLNKDYG